MMDHAVIENNPHQGSVIHYQPKVDYLLVTACNSSYASAICQLLQYLIF